MSEKTNTDTATVVLVHGAFADASSWNGVIARLQAKGVPVTAPANPLRGIAADSAYIAAVLEQIEGPVVAVGHSYGGAVITNAATAAKNVVGLVFVAAFAPDEGERLGEADGRVRRTASSDGALVPQHYPTADGATGDGVLRSTRRRFRDAFAADLSEEQAALIGSDPAAHRRARILRADGPAGMEAPTVVGGRPHQRPGRRYGCDSARWRSGPGRRSPRSRART